MLRWDVFISHASEDKKDIATALYDYLSSAGLKIWFDKFELNVGDSIYYKINEGLSQSTFAIIILSKAFIKKKWTKKELAVLNALEISSKNKILPILHGITYGEALKFYPMLADKLHLTSLDGIENIGEKIIDQIISSKYSTNVVKKTLMRLIRSKTASADIVSFFQSHQLILVSTLKLPAKKYNFYKNIIFYDIAAIGFQKITFEIVISEPNSTNGKNNVFLFKFITIENFFDDAKKMSIELHDIRRTTGAIYEWNQHGVARHNPPITNLNNEANTNVEFFLIPTNKFRIDASEQDFINNFNRWFSQCSILSFDEIMKRME